MARLSANFDSKEFRCSCGCGKLLVDERLVQALQELRDLVKVPIIITSGYRCPEYNEKIGGAKRSRHTMGQAADVNILYMRPEDMYKAALKVETFRNGGIGIYIDRKFCHLDCRRGKARWAEMGGKRVKYFDFSKETEDGKVSKP